MICVLNFFFIEHFSETLRIEDVFCLSKYVVALVLGNGKKGHFALFVKTSYLVIVEFMNNCIVGNATCQFYTYILKCATMLIGFLIFYRTQMKIQNGMKF